MKNNNFLFGIVFVLIAVTAGWSWMSRMQSEQSPDYVPLPLDVTATSTPAATTTPPASTSTPVSGGTKPTPLAACRPTGCSGQICSDQDVASTCEYRESYACYKTAKCERQTTGFCGWTETAELRSCLMVNASVVQ